MPRGRRNIVPQSINRVESFNGEVVPTMEEPSGLKMNAEDRLISMKNAIKILPPNMIKNGRHLKENVQAICGFMVTEEMMDKAYEGFTHEEF